MSAQPPESLGDNLEENHDRFFVEALAQGCIWGLEGPGGWALCPSARYPQTDVMPFWSQPEFAQTHCTDDWSIYQPVAVSIEEFMDDWLPGMHEDVLLVGLNWNEAMEGEELEPLDLLAELEAELP